MHLTIEATAKTAIFAVARQTLRQPLRKGPAGEPWVPPRTNHRFDGVFLDLVYLGRLVQPGAIVIVDDYQLPAVARAVSFCTTNLGWTVEQTSADDPQHHWAALRTARSPDLRRFDHYVEF
jgi:hypothetical protein